jgi:hypothetical protein
MAHYSSEFSGTTLEEIIFLIISNRTIYIYNLPVERVKYVPDPNTRKYLPSSNSSASRSPYFTPIVVPLECPWAAAQFQEKLCPATRSLNSVLVKSTIIISCNHNTSTLCSLTSSRSCLLLSLPPKLSYPVLRPNRVLIVCVPRNQVYTHTVQKMDTK